MQERVLVIPKRKIFPEGLLLFILLIMVTVILTYGAPRIFASIWYVVLLILYYRSRDEAFWLAFFIVTVDGFMGFLGLFSVTLSVLPDMPAIELSQFYIILTFLKAIFQRKSAPVFFNRYMQVLLLYLVFLIVWGQMMGFSGALNAYFRILKLTLPFILFYSIPRLFTDIRAYEKFFGYIFFILITGFLTQLLVIVAGISFTANVDLTEEQLSEASGLRPFYNGAATLLGLFGALFLLSGRKPRGYSPYYLYFTIAAAIGMVFLSATRGWILSFTFILILSFFTVLRKQSTHLVRLLAVISIMLVAGLSNSRIRDQSVYSLTRLESLEALTEGDNTAEAAGGKTVAVANRVHLIDNLFQRVARAQEVAVHGMGSAILGYRLYRCVQRLGEYLPAENPRGSAGAFADEQVLVDGLDFEVGEQFFQISGQGNSPAVPTGRRYFPGSRPLTKISK